MTERPILRLLNPRNADRRKGAPRKLSPPQGPSRQRQGVRFQATFDRVAAALGSDNPSIELKQNPAGIAPERALVFITAGEIQGFARAAREAGLEVIAELDLDDTDDFPDGFEPAGTRTSLSPALYATMPTIDALDRLLSLWRKYSREGISPLGAAPWWRLFDLLIELRPWGPEDRFPESARTAVSERLPFNDNDESTIEIEIWPTANAGQRTNWRISTEVHIHALGGRIIDRSSIAVDGFIYDAILAALSAGAIRELIANPDSLGGLASLEGVQFILPQTIAQAPPMEVDAGNSDMLPRGIFNSDAPIRAALLDGTPAAAHPALNGGVEIEDVHDIVQLSQVSQRYHATSMASLILRGDLNADGVALNDTRLVAVPLLVDADGRSTSPPDKLIVDLLHTALAQLFLGDEPLAPQVFVVNLSIGIAEMRFAGRISALARLIDWWASRAGVLFVVSAGNISDDLILTGVNTIEFEDATTAERQKLVRTALRESAFDRCLLAPAEAINGITVGALSEDLSDDTQPPAVASVIRLEDGSQSLPSITSALGLGLFRAIKPDFLTSGGIHELRIHAAQEDARLSVIESSQRNGLIVASPRLGSGASTCRSRGTSCAAALATRAILQAAEALVEDGGPYQGQELPREDLALLTRALAVNSARWPEDANQLYREELLSLGKNRNARAKEEVTRHFGHGVLSPSLMCESPSAGVTLVGLGEIRKDQAKIFDMPLPEMLSGERAARSMRLTLAWFSPVDASRVRYRLASLEAIAADADGDSEFEKDDHWGLNLKGDGPDTNMVKRGTVWSRRLVHRSPIVPAYNNDTSLPIWVQCRDASGGGLDPDLDLRFAIAVTLEVETPILFDIYDDIRASIRLRLRGNP